MAYAYFDTSALIRRDVHEPGRREIQHLLRTNHCVVSAVLPVEVQSALRRRVTKGTLQEKQISTILKRFTTDREFWTIVAVSREVLAAAEALTAAYPLRALDAIHVASAQLFATRVVAPAFTFVSADVRQTTAATALAITTRLIESRQRAPA